MAKMNWTRVFLGAIAYLIISQVMHAISSVMAMDYYIDPNYFAVWSKIMMPGMGPPPTEFYVYSILSSFIVGLIYSYIYVRVKEIMKGTVMKKGMKYGLAIFLMAGIPFFLSLYLLVNLPLGLLVYWLIIDGLLTYLLGGIAIAWLNK